MVVEQADSARDESRGDSGTITECEDSVDRLSSDGLHDVIRCRIRSFKVHRDGAISPGVIELMTTVGYKNNLDTQLARDVIETARLITKFGSEEQQARHWYPI
jgi:hypothetical protein